MLTPRCRHGLLTASLIALASCGSTATEPSSSPQSTLVFTRADSSTIQFPAGATYNVGCGPYDGTYAPAPSVHAYFWSPGGNPNWQLRAVLADVAVNVPFNFPNEFLSDQPKGADFFVADVPNKVSTQESGSTGSITFQKLDCNNGGEVQFSIDALIQSQVGGTPIRVKGTFHAPI